MIPRQAAALAPGWHRVLDYGCGSGILAIGAAKFGATDIDAVDIDEAAVQERERRAHAREGRGDEAELARALADVAQANARAVKVAARVARLWTTEGSDE